MDWIYAGQELVIPASGEQQAVQNPANPPQGQAPAPSAPAPTAAASSTAEGGSTYVVQRGDSLGSISWKLGVEMNSLITANGLTNPNYIQAGQTLVVPEAGLVPVAAPLPEESAAQAAEQPQPKAEPPIEAVAPARGEDKSTYTVVHGDTLGLLAGRFGVAVVEIMSANGLTNADYIYSGQQLIIPQPGQQVEAAVQPPQEAVAPESPEEAPVPVAQTAQEQLPETIFTWPLPDYQIINYYWAWHPGIDLVVDIGTPVLASLDGEVEFSGWNVNGYGYLVILHHGGGKKTLYAHNSELLVAEGDWVHQGQTIALSGSTGNSNWPHVHFELIFEDVVRVNPCSHLPGGCS